MYRKLKSGNWQLIQYSHKENGKSVYVSFTGPKKADAWQKYLDWEAEKKRKKDPVMPLKEAVKAYVEMKAAVLSPSTIIGYNKILKNNIEPYDIADVAVDKLSTAIAQSWISELARKGYTPKSIVNAYGLLSATVEMFAPDTRLKVRLPQKKKPDLYTPDAKNVDAIVEYVRKQGDQAMVVSILLAAYIPARRGEICALTHADIDRDAGTVTINKAMVLTPDKEWIIKSPKTAAGVRTVELPPFVLAEIPDGSGPLVRYTPDQLSVKFGRYVEASGVPHFRFHDLRHFGASMYLTVMSPRYVQDRGGWSSGYVMQNVYNNVIDLEKTKQTRKAFQKLKRKAAT